MRKKIILIATVVIIIIALLFTALIINPFSPKSSDIKSNEDLGNDENFPLSYTNNNPVSYSQASLISYTHPSGKFSYNYPNTWEFVPKREDMGLRPLAYSGFSKNEIVTILYFPNKGTDLRKQAIEYDGGTSEDWNNIILNTEYETILYTHSSDTLTYYSYWNGNGIDAVKVMFRKYNSYPVDGHTDNSAYQNDFNTILNSFKFL